MNKKYFPPLVEIESFELVDVLFGSNDGDNLLGWDEFGSNGQSGEGM